MSHLVSTSGPQQPGEGLRCRTLRRKRQATFNKRREPKALDTIRVDSSQEIIEHRSVISGGLFLKSSKIHIDHRSVGPAATLLRHVPTPKLVESAQRSAQSLLHGQAAQGEDARCVEKVLARD